MDQHYQPRIVLQPVGNTTVEVVASSMTAVDPTDVKTATNYDASRIDTLPTGRGINAIAALTPGVTQTWSVGGRLQIRGAMTSGNLFLVDGQNLMDNTYNNLQYPVINDSFEEMQVITGAISAEYGNVDGGVINTLTKSGGNKFEGQARLDFSAPKWNAVKPYQDRDAIPDTVSKNWTYTVGGFIFKDKLWFHVSYQTSTSESSGAISSLASIMPSTATAENKAKYGGRNAPYTDKATNDYLQLKLTYNINQDHYVVATYNNSTSSNTQRNYSAGDLKCLIPQDNEFQFWNLAWRATWSPSFTSEVRVGAKHQKYGAGSLDGNTGPIYNYASSDPSYNLQNDANSKGITGYASGSNYRFYYNNGIFNSNDGGDSRDNMTANLKGSYFLNAAGTHEIDFGLDYYSGTREARNEQSPYNLTYNGIRSNVDFGVYQYGYDATGRPMAAGNDVWFMWSTAGTADQTTMGLYVNDKWKVDNHLAVLVGVRWDRYDAKATDTGSIAGASGISPRLGVTYDLFGNQDWVFKASYCIYNGAVLENITSAASGVGKMGSKEYHYTGAKGYQPLEVIYNLGNYGNGTITGIYQGGATLVGDFGDSYVSYYEHSSATTRINPNMKAPNATEMQLSASYSFDYDKWGKGFASLTYVNKKWGNLLDYRIGWNGTVNTARIPGLQGQVYDENVFLKYWDNEPDAKRDYTALEFQAAYQWNKFNLSGNITWSQLKGNYEGEASSSPGTGQGLHNIDYIPGNLFGEDPGTPNLIKLYDWNQIYPYGYLQGHTPIAMRWQADYTFGAEQGFKTVVGLAYRFDSGYHYSKARTAWTTALNPDYFDFYGYYGGEYDAELLYNYIGLQYTQYADGQRRTEAFHSQKYFDLSVNGEFPIFKLMDYKIRGFYKAAIYNVFNHQQLVTWTAAWTSVGSTVAQIQMGPGALNLPWTEVQPNAAGTNAYHGRSDSAGNWGAARSLSFSVGVRF